MLSCNEDLRLLVNALLENNGVLRQALRDHKERLDVCIEGLSQQVTLIRRLNYKKGTIGTNQSRQSYRACKGCNSRRAIQLSSMRKTP